jgi:hypothetical protein
VGTDSILLWEPTIKLLFGSSKFFLKKLVFRSWKGLQTDQLLFYFLKSRDLIFLKKLLADHT